MVARRPSRISEEYPNQFPEDDESLWKLLHAIEENNWEGEAAATLQNMANAQIPQSTANVPTVITGPAGNPALTGNGPDPAANFFWQARANHQSTPQRLPSTLGTVWPSHDTVPWLSVPGNPSYDFSYTSHGSRCRQSPDLLESSDAYARPLLQTVGIFTDTGMYGRQVGDELCGNYENKATSRKKKAKRARRARQMRESSSEENPPHSHDAPHGAALLRSLRLRRSGLPNHEDHSEDSLPVWDPQDIRDPSSSLKNHHRFTVSEGLVSTARVGNSTQDSYPETREEHEMKWDKDVPTVGYVQPGMGTGVLSYDDHLASLQGLPAREEPRSPLRSRRPRASSPPQQRQTSRRRLLRATTARAYPETRDHEGEDSGNDSASTGSISNLDRRIRQMLPNTVEVAPRNLSRPAEYDINEDIDMPVWRGSTGPILIAEQQPLILPESAPMMSHCGSSISPHNLFELEHIAPANSLEAFTFSRQDSAVENERTRKTGALGQFTTSRFSACDPIPIAQSSQLNESWAWEKSTRFSASSKCAGRTMIYQMMPCD
jgi:hypothetical protein